MWKNRLHGMLFRLLLITDGDATQVKGKMLKDQLDVVLGTYVDDGNYQDCGVRWLFLSVLSDVHRLKDKSKVQSCSQETRRN